MLIITNRNINKSNFIDGIGDHNAFGDRVNSKGPNEVRLANAEKVDGKWQVILIKEPSVITENNIPSQKQFLKLRDKLTSENKNCVFFVHGFNQSFKKNLEKSRALEEEHGVEVIAFSWPSNPGGFKTKEYRHAKRTARASVGALDSTLEKLGSYLKEPFNREALESCNVKFSIMTYSLGNYLFQNYIVDSAYENETSIFDNVVLCQADVDNVSHATWVDLIETGKKVYVTINENDWVLKWSDVNFQKARLGRSAKNLNSKNAIYFDFTGGKDVGKTHGLFYKKTNEVVKDIFTTILNGNRGDEVKGMSYHARSNTYRF
ncbi:alpha/beta hydrolase [Shewanella sp. 1_MG-2023]|uniref:alpha/beta hydrolase n=1 Tax=unclassified Shewanella TaxID=196818 RepID=UPI0026E494D7|nr:MULTISPECIES: alpha/beta hydrolase [unclassified Shewanella]MDO6613726.1 alpha/beta hydrolase [Shewanella sp. 7_MG-2023]MDO6772666.1 alpha/beta hydrolase [Shewanella sp. 2_MG-2023]MDO6796530.1 alpha/beta hydrolase [Shewanella sp. 1_MG-2023]